MWYDSMVESGPISWQNELNLQNDAFLQEPGKGLTSDEMFLNFDWDEGNRLTNSANRATRWAAAGTTSSRGSTSKAAAGIRPAAISTRCFPRAKPTLLRWESTDPTGLRKRLHGGSGHRARQSFLGRRQSRS